MNSKDQPSATAQAKAYGIDISILDANLERTPTERILIHESALQTVIVLQEAMMKENALGMKNDSKDSSTTPSK